MSFWLSETKIEDKKQIEKETVKEEKPGAKKKDKKEKKEKKKKRIKSDRSEDVSFI